MTVRCVDLHLEGVVLAHAQHEAFQVMARLARSVHSVLRAAHFLPFYRHASLRHNLLQQVSSDLMTSFLDAHALEHA